MIFIREASHLCQAFLKTSQTTESWNFEKIPTPTRDMAAKRSKIQKVGRGATFCGLETMVIDIFSKFQLYMVQDASRNA